MFYTHNRFKHYFMQQKITKPLNMYPPPRPTARKWSSVGGGGGGGVEKRRRIFIVMAYKSNFSGKFQLDQQTTCTACMCVLYTACRCVLYVQHACVYCTLVQYVGTCTVYTACVYCTEKQALPNSPFSNVLFPVWANRTL